MELTDKQKWVLYKIVTDLRNGSKEVIMGGYAGTGKSTLIKYLIQFFPNFGVCAYTGKASAVLRKKSIPATTIHSKIYKPYFDNGVVYFDITDSLGCEGFIVDEASMVSKDISEDLQSFNIPIVYIGDHGQLEAIDSDFNIMKNPDYTLEEIHRNAGDIPKFAEKLRHGFAAQGFKGQDGSVKFIRQKLTDEMLIDADQIICAYNKTRVAINAQVREALGFKGLLNVGERVMCLRNNRTENLFNGMQGKVAKLYTYRRGTYMDFEFDGEIIEGIKYDQSQFGQENYQFKYGKSTPNPFDYCSCITCHKSQGDEWEKVLVIEQKCDKWNHRRWSYTAASRAKSELLWKLST